jgi:hypothetical protein
MSDAPATSSVSTPAAQPAPARTPAQQSDALDARIAEKRSKAEGVLAPPRGVDGKFQPGEKPAPEKKADATVVDEKAPEKKPDADHERLKADHAKAVEERDALKARDLEWTAMAEKVSARLQTQGQRIAQLEAMLKEKGVEIDPRDIELVRYREREAAQKLAEERAAAEADAKKASDEDAKRSQARSALTAQATAALEKYPELRDPANQQDLVKFLRLSWRGMDVDEAAEMVAAKIKTRAPTTKPQVPKTLAGSGAGGAGPKLTDPRDIADKWKARLRTA